MDQQENTNLTKIIREQLKNECLYLCFGGGVGSFGRNFSIFYFNGSILWIDIGCGFPSYNLPGLRRTIPSHELLEAFRPDAIILTHAHEDHIGALPYVYPLIPENTPIYSSSFTHAIIRKKLRDHKINPEYFSLKSLNENSEFQVKDFTLRNFFINHSIPQSFSLGILLKKKELKLYYTSDFKSAGNETRYREKDISDFGPINYLLCDSTGTLNAGHSVGEQVIAENLEKVIQSWPGRIFVTTFASQIDRIIAIQSLAKKYNRILGIKGQSIITHLEAAYEAGIVQEPFWQNRRPEADTKNALWLISGCQADDGSSLQRFADDKLSPLKPQPGDLLIYSASVIPSNVEMVNIVLNKIARAGTKIIGLSEDDPKVHASGHARSDDLSKLINQLNPQSVIPIHGDHLHFIRFHEIINQGQKRKLHILDDNCIYYVGKDVSETMRLPFIPQMIEDGEIHTEYSLYAHRVNISNSGICNLVIQNETKRLEQIQYIGTSSQDWLNECMPELTDKIQKLLFSMYESGNTVRDRKVKQKIAKINASVLKKNPYVNIIWI